jgi:hypothetical protein
VCDSRGWKAVKVEAVRHAEAEAGEKQVSLSEREMSNRPLGGSVRTHGHARAAFGWAWAAPKGPKRRRHERGETMHTTTVRGKW